MRQNDALQEMWKHQGVAKEFMLRYKRVFLGDEMGVGKTRPALRAYREVCELYETPPLTLILATKPLVWLTEAEKLHMKPPALIEGARLARQEMWADPELNFVICTHGLLRTDGNPTKTDIQDMLIQEDWDIIITDEAHHFRNRKTQGFKALKRITRNAEYVWLLSGSPAKKGAQDLWAPLNIVTPKQWPSFWKFIENYTHVHKGPFGTEIIGTRNLPALRGRIKTQFMRRRKKDVHDSLPPKHKYIEPIQMTPKERSLYRRLSEDMIVSTGNKLIAASTTLARDIKLRKLLVSPKLLDPKLEWGSTYEAMLSDVDECGGHCVVFTPFRESCHLICEYLNANGFPNTFITYGRMSTKQQQEALRGYERTKGIMVATVLSSESHNWQSASYGFFCGYEWIPDDNLQAEFRIYRGEITVPVTIKYYMHKGTVEEDILHSLNTRQRNLNQLFRKDPSLLLNWVRKWYDQ